MTSYRISVALTLLVLAACQPADQHETTRASDSGAVGDGTDGGRSATAEGPPHGHGAADTLGLEPRPLLPIMQQLGVDMTALTHALFTDDYATVTQRAAAVADHAPISAADVARIDAILGTDMAAFEALDANTHRAAVRLHEAATARDVDALLARLSEVQSGCVACHARFRERLRTNPQPGR